MSTSLQKDFRSGGSGKNDTVVFLAEDGRTRYVPPEPTVKILKRPPILSSSHNAGGDGFIINGDSSVKPKQPIKTLQQRELEYAEARLRILGEAQSPDERPALLERIRRIQNKSEVADTVLEQTGVAIFSPSAVNQTVIPSPGNSVPIISPQPMIIMTSTSTQLSSMPSLSQTHVTASNNCVSGNCGNSTGQYNVVTNSLNASFDNVGNRFGVGYGVANKGGVYGDVIHGHRHQNSYGACNNSSPAAVFTGTGIINTSMMSPVGNNFVAIQAPISLNLAIRQPRGPDGTKGFNNFRSTLR